MSKKIILSFFLILFLFEINAQIPNPSLIGYWQNWNDINAPNIQLDAIDNRYNIVEIAFAVPTSPSDMNMLFVPDGISQSAFIAKIQALKSQGKKVLISIGGATTSVDITSTANKNAFINSMNSIINTYGFDGIDIDIENGNSILILNGGTIAAPNNIAIQNLIAAIKSIMLNYRVTNSKKLMLTMTPETAYVQGGQSAFGGIWGGYLPTINALRDSIDILQVQLYNSGSMFGLDGNVYNQGSADFIIAMTEALIQGFNTSGGFFNGLPANKVAIGLPACPNAAGGGYVSTTNVKAAIKYLMGNGPKPGSYQLIQSGGYPGLRGMMTWSINWDAVNTCATSYEYAQNYETIFGNSSSCSLTANTLYSTPCPGSTASASISSTGSTGGVLNYLWNDGNTQQQRNNLLLGTYSYTITDITSACQASDTFTINNSSCAVPVSVSASSITNSSVIINWSSNASCAVKYRLQYRITGTTNWTTTIVPSSQFSKILLNLISGTTYQYRLRTQCNSSGSSLSPWSSIQSFTTLNNLSCSTPTSINSSSISSTTSTINWSVVNGVYKYRLRYRILGSSNWVSVIVPPTSTSIILSDLVPSSTYEYQLRSQCDNSATIFSAYSSLYTFSTLSLRSEEISTIENVLIYPNPTNSNISINLISHLDQTLSISVTNIIGQEVSSIKWDVSSGINQTTIDLKSLSEGVYYFKIIGLNFNILNRIIKIK
jgi:chitinase